MTLNSDNRTCDFTTVDDTSIIVATKTDIYRLYNNNQNETNSIVHLSKNLHLKNVGALVFNPSDNSIIYSDTVDGVIYSMDLNTRREVVLFENADVVEGLDVDPSTESIYWTERSRGTIVKFATGRKHLNGVRERLVLARQLKNPRAIAIAPELNLMFVVEGSESYVITVWETDGNWLNNLVQVHGTVTSMVYDDKHLYFTDSLRGTIERMEVGGSNRTVLQEHLKTPIAISLTLDSVFWLTGHSRINWLNKQDPETKHEFSIGTTSLKNVEQYRLMVVVNNLKLSRNGSTGDCITSNGSE
jgi:WD40 repeat protein